MNRILFSRLSAMMFLQYFVPGCILPILSLYLKNYLHFSAMQVGWVLAMPALAGVLSPYLVANIADRFVRAETMLALTQFGATAALFALAHQTAFVPVLICYFLWGACFGPSLGLSNAVTLHHVPSARRFFGMIRGIGTAGWCSVAWIFGYFYIGNHPERITHAIYWAAGSAFVYGLYCLTLPHSNVEAAQRQTFTYWKALRMFLRPSLLVLCFLGFVGSVVHQCYYYGVSPYLHQVGFANRHIMPSISLGQICEIIMLFTLGFFLPRLGVKRTMIVGALAQALRYAIFAFWPSQGPVLVALALHGICYAFFFTAAYLYVEEHSVSDTRAGAQQLFTLIICLGNFGGFILAGQVAQFVTDPATDQVNFFQFWLVPASLALVVTGIIALFFYEEPAPEIRTTSASPSV